MSLDGGDAYVLKMDIPGPADSVAGAFLFSWAEQVNAASGGRINIIIYPDSQLGAAEDIIANLKSGKSDIAWASPAMFPGRFPVTGGADLPSLNIPDHVTGTNFLYKLYEDTDLMQKEYEGIRPLALYTAAPYCFASGKSSVINGVADLRGMKIRTEGVYSSAFLSALGAEPVELHAGSLYEQLSQGEIDGHFSDLTVYGTWELSELTGNIIESPIYRFTAFLLMNPESYAELPDELRSIIDEYSKKELLAYGLGQAFDEASQSGIELCKEAGALVMTLSEEDTALVATAAEIVEKKWIEDMNSAGYDGQAVFDVYKSMLASHNK
jgi:TRAP-type C4-dicarboxylate transport system substrate-binding protein